jgi:hypothetical protein
VPERTSSLNQILQRHDTASLSHYSKMSLQTAADIPIQVTSETAGSERRISPSWTIAQLKSKLELITGIPPSSQRLELNRPGENSIPIKAVDEEVVQLSNFPLVPYAEIYVSLDASLWSKAVKTSPVLSILSTRRYHLPWIYARQHTLQTPAS